MHILIRLAGEMIVKSSQVRSQFQKQLGRNIEDAFKASSIPMSLTREWSRFFLHCEDPRALEILQRIFGIHSFSIVEHSCPPELDAIVACGQQAYRAAVVGKTFAVRAKRTGPQPFTSMDVQRHLGAALNPEGLRGRVNLTSPEYPIFVEVRPEAAFFYSQSIKGAGGLPLGSGGRALCLLSGGFDSAIAAWMLQRRGVKLDFVLCNLAGDAYERSVLQVAKYLADHWSYGYQPQLYVVDFQGVAAAIKEHVTNRFAQVVLKRLFYRCADQLASKLHALALVTGEAIGQVSSQTLANLRAIDESASLPVMRPLISYDKEDIIDLARKIGTYDLCVSIQEFCQLVPDRPSTACRLEKAQEQEALVDAGLITKALNEARSFNLRKLTQHDLTTPYIFRDDIPGGATVIDCRPKHEYDEWHYANAIHQDYYELLDNFKSFDKKGTYLVYCGVGMQSAVVAEKMQREGFLAYSYKGGIAKLQEVSSH